MDFKLSKLTTYNLILITIKLYFYNPAVFVSGFAGTNIV